MRVAGQANLCRMKNFCMSFSFAKQAYLFCTDADYFRSLLDKEAIERERYPDRRTAAKWTAHLEELLVSDVIKMEDTRALQFVSTHFAVFKTPQTSRAIFNGLRISSCTSVPPVVNLPHLPTTLRRIAVTLRQLPNSWLVTGDWRHFFHQFRCLRKLAVSSEWSLQGQRLSMDHASDGALALPLRCPVLWLDDSLGTKCQPGRAL